MRRLAISVAVAGALLLPAFLTASALAVPPTISQLQVSSPSTTSIVLEAKVNPEKKATFYHFEYGTGDCASNPCTSVPAVEPNIGSGSAPVAVEAKVSGLTPGTTYHFRVVAHHSGGSDEVKSPDHVFSTFAPPPVFGSCPNDAFRGEGPSGALSDCRAYEQASPVDKNGADVNGTEYTAKASVNGDRVSFTSSSPIPRGEGSQTFNPFDVATRSGGGWSTRGMMPPQNEADDAGISGWTPDLSQVFAWARIIHEPYLLGLLGRSSATGAVTTIVSPAAKFVEPVVSGVSDDGAVVFFEGEGAPLLPNAAPGKPNLYVWDRETGIVSLAGVLNDETAPAGGTTAGRGRADEFHTSISHAASTDGSSVYFSDAKSGQLYLRLNPTEPQSALNGAGDCTEADRACTIHVSASRRSVADPAGTARAFFQMATPDGAHAYFTSSEELTDDANTGPEQPPAQIGEGKIGASEVEEEEPSLLLTHALGMATDPAGEYVYWVNSTAGTIGRAKLNGPNPPSPVEPEYIVPGETEAVTDPVGNPGVFESAPSTPRYVAVDDEYVYWTNSGPIGENPQGARQRPMLGGGTIGRAKIGATEGLEVKPEFIKGASNPQGIAVDSGHIYWGNADESFTTIGRASIGGGGAEQTFFDVPGNGVGDQPQGLAVNATDLYFARFESANGSSSISRIPIGGGSSEFFNIGKTDIRGIALDSTHVYWSAPGEEAIGRNLLSGFGAGCPSLPSCERTFHEPGGQPFGLAIDGEHLYWSVNGETPPNPGSDLYRYDVASGDLTDLTPDSSDIDGAGVREMLGMSDDGSYRYFAANAVLTNAPNERGETASVGDCHGPPSSESGTCNVYLDHEGQIAFIARLDSINRNWLSQYKVSGVGAGAMRAFRITSDGRTALFNSRRPLTDYDNRGIPELYRYRVGSGFLCVSCNPSGAPASGAPSYSSIVPAGVASEDPPAALNRNLSADGNRVFFETTEALVAADVNGAEGCPAFSCRDVYEWEAKGSGSCESEFQDGGCLYLVSTGTGSSASYLADASASGDDVFLFTRQQLVGQDEDSLVDVYDARVGGGLASQNEPAPQVPCEAEGCKGGVAPGPQDQSPGTANFAGPPNPNVKKPKPRCVKGKHRVKGRCVKSHKRHRRAHHDRRARR